MYAMKKTTRLLTTMLFTLLLIGCKKDEPVAVVDPATAYLGDYDCRVTTQSTVTATGKVYTLSDLLTGRIKKLSDGVLDFRILQDNGRSFQMNITGNTFILPKQSFVYDPIGGGPGTVSYLDVMGNGKLDNKTLTLDLVGLWAYRSSSDPVTLRKDQTTDATACNCVKK